MTAVINFWMSFKITFTLNNRAGKLIINAGALMCLQKEKSLLGRDESNSEAVAAFG